MLSIPSPPVAIFEKAALANGIRVVTAPMPQVGSVSCFLMLAAGSRYETRASQGIAHFAEHMFFKGTEKRPTARSISAEIDAIGGEFNAFTGKELTGYYVRCATETRDVALDDLQSAGVLPPEVNRRELHRLLQVPGNTLLPIGILRVPRAGHGRFAFLRAGEVLMEVEVDRPGFQPALVDAGVVAHRGRSEERV